MMSTLMRSSLLLLAVACAPGGADAALQLRVPGTAPSGACQPALPTFDGNIRKRPVAVQNEGGSVAFVTCAWPAEGTAQTDRASMRLINNTSNALTVSCTLVQGVSGTGTAITQSAPVPANTQLGIIEWDATDNGGIALSPVLAASCALPPGAGVGYLSYRMSEDVGS